MCSQTPAKPIVASFDPKVSLRYLGELRSFKNSATRIAESPELIRIPIVGHWYRSRSYQSMRLAGAITLMQEEGNEADPNAIQVFYRGQHIAYVARELAPLLRKYWDQMVVINGPNAFECFVAEQ